MSSNKLKINSFKTDFVIVVLSQSIEGPAFWHSPGN